MPTPNQIDKQLQGFFATNQELTAIPEGTRTEHGFRHNISVTLDGFYVDGKKGIQVLGYLDSWLRGVGCVPLYNLMEDAATAEISRSQLWQWLRHDARLEDGRTIDAQLVKQTIAAETERRLIRAGSVVSRYCNKFSELYPTVEEFVQCSFRRSVLSSVRTMFLVSVIGPNRRDPKPTWEEADVT
ncbi:unnamed protein product [Haemonchus placei]|uniref:Malate synthase n=1 Tax=Haemonchus placei TaxID=6290 RepID=A0A0N4VZG8_HAEPC|nr:unnamed protein product [Haemonchus placei]